MKSRHLVNGTLLRYHLKSHQKQLWIQRRLLTVLGIESSCDDTCASLMNENGEILSDSRQSQMKHHLDRGGVMPNFAKVMHCLSMESVVRKALDDANMKMSDVDAIAVTTRPGLKFSLFVGTDYAKRLAIKYGKPLIPVHHMEAHATTGFLCPEPMKFPFLSLLISGGHGQFVAVKNPRDYYLLGDSMDIAPGEAFDKIARRLKVKNLGSPFDEVCGGAAVEMLAPFGNPNKYFTGSNLLKFRGCDINYNNVRSVAIQMGIKLESQLDLPVDCPVPQLCDILASAQKLLARILCKGIQKAVNFLETTDIFEEMSAGQGLRSFGIDYNKEVKPMHLPLVISGGVACNQYLINYIKSYCKFKLVPLYETTTVQVVVPPPSLCADNGVMIAWNGLLKLLNKDLFTDNPVLSMEEDIQKVVVEPRASIGVDLRHMVRELGNSKEEKAYGQIRGTS